LEPENVRGIMDLMGNQEDFFFRRGHPGSAAFHCILQHSATTAHVPWFSHGFATIDNFCLVFLQWLNKTKLQKNKENKKPKNNMLCSNGIQTNSWMIYNGKSHRKIWGIP